MIIINTLKPCYFSLAKYFYVLPVLAFLKEEEEMAFIDKTYLYFGWFNILIMWKIK